MSNGRKILRKYVHRIFNLDLTLIKITDFSISRTEQFLCRFVTLVNMIFKQCVGSKRYSMEAQVMHWNMRYGSIDKCFDKPDGIAILSYLMQV